MSIGAAETFLLAVALGCDAFAVGLGVGIRCSAPRQVFRLSFHFGLFQFLMPLLGWYLGLNLIGPFRRWAPWVAFGLLTFFGLKMLWEGLVRQGDEFAIPDPTRGLSLVILSVATSLDALGVGFGLGVLGSTIFMAAVWIGLTAGAMTWSGMKLGNRLSLRFGKRLGVAGGLILLVIAIKIAVF